MVQVFLVAEASRLHLNRFARLDSTIPARRARRRVPAAAPTCAPDRQERRRAR